MIGPEKQLCGVVVLIRSSTLLDHPGLNLRLLFAYLRHFFIECIRLEIVRKQKVTPAGTFRAELLTSFFTDPVDELVSKLDKLGCA